MTDHTPLTDEDDLLDDAMRPHLPRLNAIPGVETLQSCAGHLAGESRPASSDTCASSGSLWFRATGVWSDTLLGQIATWPEVECVSKLWNREPFPVIEIIFPVASRDAAIDRLVERLCGVSGEDGGVVTVRSRLKCGHTRDGICSGAMWCDECQDFSYVVAR